MKSTCNSGISSEIRKVQMFYFMNEHLFSERTKQVMLMSLISYREERINILEKDLLSVSKMYQKVNV